MTIQKMLLQVFLLGDDAIVRVFYRDSGWRLVTRKGLEYRATLRPDSVVSQWFVLLNFNMDKNMDNLDNQRSNKREQYKLKNIIGSRTFTRFKNLIQGKKKSVLILPDGLLINTNIEENAEEFRRLKVFLRFGKGIG